MTLPNALHGLCPHFTSHSAKVYRVAPRLVNPSISRGIRAVLRFNLQPRVADNMLPATNLTRLEFKGRANRITKTDHQRMQRSLMQQFSSTQVHPDHQVENSRGDTFYSGNGNWEKKFSNGQHRKTYHWELVLDE